MKKLFFIVLAIVVGFLIATFIPVEEKIKGWTAESDAIVGSASNLKSVPFIAVFAHSTTTAPSGEYNMADGGATLTQGFSTENVDEVKLYIMAKGDTATSTLNIRQQASFDNANFFDIATSTLESRVTATTTVADSLTAITWDPGTATTSKVVTFDTKGFSFSRFIVWGDNLSTDPNDGVQAFIKIIKLDNK